MALQSEVSPPMVGDANKDTKIDGDTKSDDNSSQSTDEGGDLEEGEILDSGEEGGEEKDFTNSSLKEALDKNCLLSIEQLVSQAKNAEQNSVPKKVSPRKLNQMAAKYTDHDKVDDNSDTEDGWFPPSPKYKSKFEDKPIDYRMELAAYRGTPPSSPERKRRDDKPRKKRSSKKSKKSGKKAINRKDIKGMRVMKYKKEVMRMKSCKFFKEGKCAKGAECGYSHVSPQSYKKKELCKFYLNGHCNKGKECLYMHSEFPCKFYHTGSECYAKDDCRFSHAPLTEEMKRILDAYLKVHHGDDDYEGRKRRVSRSPEPKGPPPKRICLLGSPPRHIREAEETKRWQEEMKLLQQQNHPGFEIHLSPCKDNMSPPQYPKPNFYQETLPNTPSPQKRRTTEASNPLNLPSDFPKSSPAGAFPTNNSVDTFNRDSPREFPYEENFIEMDVPRVKEEHDEFRWKNMHSVSHANAKGDQLKRFVEPDQQEQDFTSDIKFDETTQFSEMESSTDGPLSGSPATHSAVVHNKESEDDTSNQGNVKVHDEKLGTEEAAAEETSPQIVVPSHLPRKQRELFMRIQQHQRKNAAVPALADVSNSPRASEIAEPQIKKEEVDEDEEKADSDSKDSKWYSSEDDDDDIDQPLTNVLKKLSKAPPPKRQEAQPKTGMNLIDMLNKIQQNTLERNKPVQDPQQQQKGAFWKNLLLGTVSPANDATSVPPPIIPVPSEPKRRTLLPSPLPVVKKEPIAPPKDPRLKNRDPRTAASSATNLPKPVAVEKPHIPVSTPSAFPKVTTTTVAPVTPPTEVIKESIPYRLHGIYTKPPNYTPYIFASQSNPKLLNDPRVRKHMNLNSTESNNENGKESVIIRTSSKDVPPVPELLLKYDKPGSLINIFETTSSKLNDDVKQDAKSAAPVVAKKLSDPRMRKRDSRSSSGSDTPPLLSIAESCSTTPSLDFKAAPVLENALMEPAAEKKWLPPVLEKSWTPPLLEKNWTVSIKKEIDSDSENSSDPPRLEVGEKPVENKPSLPPPDVVKIEPLDSDVPIVPVVSPVVKKVKPTPASHLPRAIADPRMMKLHHPLDSRRSLVASLDSNKSIVERKKPQIDSTKTAESNTKKETAPSYTSEQEAVKEKPVEQKMVKSIPKKRRLSDKSEEKKKTVHRNRKSSMDYASPLNSCDTNSEKSLGYNSYNQRPKLRTAVLNSETNSSVPIATPPCLESADTTLSDYLLSDNSNLECDNSNDVNLKDMFKTIDPTASPFC